MCIRDSCPYRSRARAVATRVSPGRGSWPRCPGRRPTRRSRRPPTPARRGWLQLAHVSGTDSADGDWAITRVDQPLDASLDLNEVHLITNLASPGATASLSELCSGSDNRLGLVQLDLHREVVSRGWYPAAPNQTSDSPMAVLGVGGLLGLVIALIDVSST